MDGADGNPMVLDNAEKDRRGLVCHWCGRKHFQVIYTRERIGGLRRKRECRNCGKPMWTMERLPAS